MPAARRCETIPTTTRSSTFDIPSPMQNATLSTRSRTHKLHHAPIPRQTPRPDLAIKSPHLLERPRRSVSLSNHDRRTSRRHPPRPRRATPWPAYLPASTPKRAFILNDHPYALHGVDVHQDYLNKGWAISSAEIDESYRLIEEMGCTTVRLAHYQHPEYEYSLCDRAGIVVWAEACLVNRVGDTPGFGECAKQQLRELIKQNYNHPSIFFWSLFNELGPRTRTNWQLVHDLNDIAHELDPDRPTVAASHLPANIPLNGYTDIIAFNRYFGWYTNTLADWPTELDKLRSDLPHRAASA